MKKTSKEKICLNDAHLGEKMKKRKTETAYMDKRRKNYEEEK